MTNEDGSVVVVYNGETYNYPELRDLVLARGHQLHTTCDTEVLPHLYEDEGIGFVSRLNGIFAFALFDRRLGKLFVVRDPLGVKPLVYATAGNRQLAFGSEAKAVLASGLVHAELDEASLHLSMNVRYVPGRPHPLPRHPPARRPATCSSSTSAVARTYAVRRASTGPRTELAAAGDWLDGHPSPTTRTR